LDTKLTGNNKHSINLRTIFCGALLLGFVSTGHSQAIVEFSATSYSVFESAGSITIAAQRTGDLNSIVTADYATADGTATNGLKYLSTNGRLSFGVGQVEQTIVVPILNDGLAQGTNSFHVILSNPNSGAALGTRTNATVNILDNDIGVQFQFATYSVVEDAGSVRLAVVRGDDGTNAVSVDFSTSNLTATDGVDYTGMTNKLTLRPSSGSSTSPFLSLITPSNSPTAPLE
jgi:hypothetical protein